MVAGMRGIEVWGAGVPGPGSGGAERVSLGWRRGSRCATPLLDGAANQPSRLQPSPPYCRLDPATFLAPVGARAHVHWDATTATTSADPLHQHHPRG